MDDASDGREGRKVANGWDGELRESRDSSDEEGECEQHRVDRSGVEERERGQGGRRALKSRRSNRQPCALPTHVRHGPATVQDPFPPQESPRHEQQLTQERRNLSSRRL